MIDFRKDVRHKRQSPQQRHAVGMLRLRVQRRKQQQVLIGQLHHVSLLIRAADSEFQRVFSLPQLHLLHPSAQQRRQIPVARCRHHFAYRSAVYQQGVQILLQKRVDTELPPAHRHPFQKLPHLPIHLRVLAGHLHTAAETDQLTYGGVHHRHRFPHRLIEPQLPAALGRKASQSRKGMLFPAPELHRLHCRNGAFSPPKIQTNLSSLSESLSCSPGFSLTFVYTLMQ